MNCSIKNPRNEECSFKPKITLKGAEQASKTVNDFTYGDKLKKAALLE